MSNKGSRKASGKTILALLGLTAISGCALFGPDRKPPSMPESADYTATPVGDALTQLPTADGVSQRLQRGAPPVLKWWQAFGSAELDAWIDEGLMHSPSLGTAQDSLRAAREQLRSQIGNSVWPSIDATFAPSRQRALGIPILPDQQTFLENIFVAQVQATYTFDFFGAAIMADRALARQVDAQALQLAATRRTLVVNIVSGAINAASLQEQIRATEALVKLGEERAVQTKARFEHGSASEDDAFAAEQDAANSAATLPALRAQELAVRHALAVLLGRSPDQAPQAVALSSLQLPSDIPLAVSSDLLHQRPDILAAEATLRSAADQAGAATASMFPSMTLSASYGHGGFDWGTFSSPAGVIWSVAASVSQPLFRGGALNARRRQYLAQYDAAVDSYKLTVLSAFRTVADTLAALDEDAHIVAQTERAAAAAQGMSRNTEARYRLGATSFYATLTASQQYQASLAALARARAARLNDSAVLFDAMGAPRALQSAAR